MPGPYDPRKAAVRTSPTSSGTYTVIGLSTSSGFTEGSSGTNITYYMGGQVSKAGNPTVSGTVNYLFNRSDTLGQEAIRTARRAGTTIYIQDCPEGTLTGAKVEQVAAIIDEVGRETDAGNDWVTGSFTYTGDATTLTTVTLA
jgi:hypothetical protein